jgi:preprotein translocase subunit SecE
VNKLKQFRQFLVEVWAELKKTTWPGRQEVYGTTVVVIVTVLICASFLWVVDMMLNKGMEVVFRMAGQ